MKAFLKNYRQSPRKVRLVADLLKGKRVADAFMHLNAMPKRASGPMEQLLKSAIANAKQAGINEDNLYVSNVTVNKGIVMKRSMPRARGSASRINKRTSHILLTLVEKSVEKKVKATKAEKAEKKVTKPKVKKVVKQKVSADK
jgi:large subunit ribosomal protein L22